MRRVEETADRADEPITRASSGVDAVDVDTCDVDARDVDARDVDAVGGDAADADTLSRAVDALAIAVDHLFVTELRRGLADDDTLDLVATARELAAATTATRTTRTTRTTRATPGTPATRATHGRATRAATLECATRANSPGGAGPGDAEGTCSG